MMLSQAMQRTESSDSILIYLQVTETQRITAISQEELKSTLLLRSVFKTLRGCTDGTGEYSYSK